MKVTGQIPLPLIWYIYESFLDFSSLVVSTHCGFNQSCGYWLLSDALHFVIFMSLKLKEENQVVFSFETLMDDNSIVANELVLMDFNIKMEVCCVLNFFFYCVQNMIG
jgi:hypothetical protein